MINDDLFPQEDALLPEIFDEIDEMELARQLDEQEDRARDDEQDFMNDVQADADALASAGWGTDEDYDGSFDET